ncbi:MAG: NFACT family protein [Agathobacter sp.]|nr:NFACT family protein [Agathobacter sp.]MBQ2283249.1 NFACT family protein [Agathobacter sp.]
MALDGIVISNLVYELNQTLKNSRISKIAQPEADELLLTCKGQNGQHRLLLSASASLPFVYLTQENKPSPLTAPTFCMVLRKHIANGKILEITQPHMERIIHIRVEHLNELGDLCEKTLIIELMGKHSNIIFCNEKGMIIDSIKHVSSAMSSVREVLPGRDYFIPSTQEDKKNPLVMDKIQVMEALSGKPVSVAKAIYTTFTGISPLIAQEVAYRAGIDGDAPVASLSEEQLLHLSNLFCFVMEDIKEGVFQPVIVRNGREPVDFSSIPLTQYQDMEVENVDSISSVLENFYAEKNQYTRIRQKSVDLRKIVSTALDRNQKKYQLQMKQLKDTEKKEKYKVYGELIQAYGYGLPEGATVLEAENYYDNNKMISIPLDKDLTPLENAKKYFDRYGKLKRTYEALSELILETKNEIEHLESIQNSLDIAVSADDLVQIKEELVEFGFIKKGHGGKKVRSKSKPFHYISSDGYDIYVGKNNYQNDELTFKVATGNDWWFHAKGMPGSHVIVKSRNEELPDRVFEEAGMLAGYYSKGRDSDKIEIDYLQKKNIKKPNGSAPGFVVYYTNFSLTIHPDISHLQLIES